MISAIHGVKQQENALLALMVMEPIKEMEKL
jgi:hypothetical protein